MTSLAISPITFYLLVCFVFCLPLSMVSDFFSFAAVARRGNVWCHLYASRTRIALIHSKRFSFVATRNASRMSHRISPPTKTLHLFVGIGYVLARPPLNRFMSTSIESTGSECNFGGDKATQKMPKTFENDIATRRIRPKGNMCVVCAGDDDKWRITRHEYQLVSAHCRC